MRRVVTPWFELYGDGRRCCGVQHNLPARKKVPGPVVSDLGRIQAKEVVLDRTCAPALAEALRASKQLLVSQIERAGSAHAPSANDDLEVDPWPNS